MSIRYEFNFLEDGTQLTVETQSAKSREPNVPSDLENRPQWTQLKHCQCSNCPLDRATTSHCPAALDMQPLVEDFQSLPGGKKVEVRVIAKEREYRKVTGLEEGLRSLMGLVMANSACPILSNLKPMAFTHLPFSTQEEFIVRSVGTYLLRQYYKSNSSGPTEQPDWDLDGLIALNRELQLVNQALWQRVHSACQGDSNLKALLSFFSLSSSVSYSLETQLMKVKPAFMSETGRLQHFETPGGDRS